MTNLFVDRFHEIEQAHIVLVADVADAVGSHGGETVALGYLTVIGANRGRVNQQADGADQIGDISKVAVHVAVVVYIDRAPIEGRVDEFEQRQVLPPVGALDSDEAEHRGWEIPQMRANVSFACFVAA